MTAALDHKMLSGNPEMYAEDCRIGASVIASDWHNEDVVEFRNGPEQRSLCLLPDEARRRAKRFCAIQCHCGTRLNEQ